MTDWMWIVLILAALFGGTVYCGFRAIAAALEERAVMSEERSKIMDNLIAQDADLIETQAHEIERLRVALGWFVNNKSFVVQVGGNPNVVPSMIATATKIYFGEGND